MLLACLVLQLLLPLGPLLPLPLPTQLIQLGLLCFDFFRQNSGPKRQGSCFRHRQLALFCHRFPVLQGCGRFGVAQSPRFRHRQHCSCGSTTAAAAGCPFMGMLLLPLLLLLLLAKRQCH
jgi:hypothetical protein